jgi:hypothetical protein
MAVGIDWLARMMTDFQNDSSLKALLAKESIVAGIDLFLQYGTALQIS